MRQVLWNGKRTPTKCCRTACIKPHSDVTWVLCIVKVRLSPPGRRTPSLRAPPRGDEAPTRSPAHESTSAHTARSLLGRRHRCCRPSPPGSMMRGICCRVHLFQPVVRLLQLLGLDDSHIQILRNAVRMVLKLLVLAFLALVSLYFALAVYLHRLPPIHNPTSSDVHLNGYVKQQAPWTGWKMLTRS